MKVVATFRAWTRTRNITTAREVAAERGGIVGFCVFDGFYYVLQSAADFNAGGFLPDELPST